MFDTIKTWGLSGESYTSKVRRLGEFSPAAKAATNDREAGDVADPLYGAWVGGWVCGLGACWGVLPFRRRERQRAC